MKGADFYNIFPNWKLGSILYSKHCLPLFENLENIIFLEKQVALLKG
jgi:hypothetical protein